MLKKIESTSLPITDRNGLFTYFGQTDDFRRLAAEQHQPKGEAGSIWLPERRKRLEMRYVTTDLSNQEKKENTKIRTASGNFD